MNGTTGYEKTELTIPLTIRSVISIHYFEYTRNFTFPGESHDFWEVVYADKGNLFITANEKSHILHPGEVFLHSPLQFHTIRTDGRTAPNSIIFSFDGDCEVLRSVAGQVWTATPAMRTALSAIIQEAGTAFSTPLGDPYIKRLVRTADRANFGAEQIIRNQMELFLLNMLRAGHSLPPASSLNHKAMADRSLSDMVAYFEEHIHESLTFDALCEAAKLSPTTIKKLFRQAFGCGAMEFFMGRKVDRAKQYIREDRLNFTEIAEVLGFSSIHYFSKVFKAKTGMTPSEYARSVKALWEESGGL